MAIKTITLLPGECVNLPQGTVISSVILNGSITTSSNCTLPTPTTYACGVFYFFLDSTGGEDDRAMEEEIVQYGKITIGNNTYILNEYVITSGADPGTLNTIATLNMHVTNTALFEFKAIVRTTLGGRQRIGVYFQVPSEFFSTTVLQISDRGTLYNLPAYEATCDEYPDPE